MMGEGELDGGSQKVQPSRHKYQGHNISDVMYNMKNIINNAVCYIWKLLIE